MIEITRVTRNSKLLPIFRETLENVGVQVRIKREGTKDMVLVDESAWMLLTPEERAKLLAISIKKMLEGKPDGREMAIL